MPSHKIVNITSLKPSLQNTLSSALGISGVMAQLLINRGVNTPAEAESFLNGGLDDLLDPFAFSDMRKAVALIEQKIGNKEKIMVFGDYDVDGVTALALVKGTLHKKNADVMHLVPHRINDGYGLNKEALQLARKNNVKLLITVDCGTSSHNLIAELRKDQIDVIVTDHHESAQQELPPASAIINPKLKNCPYAYKNLAGVGVAYKLCQALCANPLKEELDLVSLGTIADVVPLDGENRIIAREGLLKLNQAKRAGIKALIEVSRIKDKKINSTFVSFILGPRINASGRMDSAEIALRLLLSRHPEDALEYARAVDSLNRQRQKIESSIFEEAKAIIEREINFKEHRVIVVAKEGWHEGVLGIVASKLADRFYRPTIVVSLNGGLSKGSGRSIKNFHLFSALVECRELLGNFGGHSHAVGLQVDSNRLEEFRQKINLLAKNKLSFEDLLPSLDVDMELGLSQVNQELAEEIELLEPFGTGNSRPLFFTRGLKVKGSPAVLGRDALKFWVSDGKVTLPAIGFGMGSFCDSLVNAENFDLVYTPRIDSWQGRNSLILEVEDIFFR
ncbi:MAG: single-stranded-DNA-specific exonuclease RecJ [Candidatus Omnitrophica bacterium]|nr:single-stranded-DNA-specific exonuclease RecJ [Candidatus Omnitrophota bacterium]MDD5513455.1 single-stranded-DNA-specific exonuclease RecJ [Candidatus Omnitrophota bacterium]